MGKIACDIVLLPSKETMKLAIRLNRELPGERPNKINLDMHNCLPHVSLFMGCVNANDIPRVRTILQEIAVYHSPVSLSFVGIRVGVSGSGESISTLEIEETDLLQALHETVADRSEPYLTHDAKPHMFFGSPEIEPSSVQWVSRYASDASFDHFSPHITIGVGTLPPEILLPKNGTADRLALCHLGNYCTCREVLSAVNLEA